MTKHKNPMSKRLKKVISVLEHSGLSLEDHRLALDEMFAAAVSNAPNDEIDNFSARKFSPVFLSLCKLLSGIGNYRRRRKLKKIRLSRKP
jgi:hypothetical protein